MEENRGGRSSSLLVSLHHCLNFHLFYSFGYTLVHYWQVLNSTCMHASTCMHLYRTFIPYIIARVLVYLIFLLLLLCSTYIIISLIPVSHFYILDLRWVATTLALINSHNSNHYVREIRASVYYIISSTMHALIVDLHTC